MSHGIDVDYTAAINFLTGYGLDELRKSGISAGLLERLDKKASQDQAAVEAISSDWLHGKMLGLSTGGRGAEARANQGAVAPQVRSTAPAQTNLKGAQMRCVRCKQPRQMKDPHIVTLKNGKRATQGVCPVCGSKMFRFGTAH